MPGFAGVEPTRHADRRHVTRAIRSVGSQPFPGAAVPDIGGVGLAIGTARRMATVAGRRAAEPPVPRLLAGRSSMRVTRLD